MKLSHAEVSKILAHHFQQHPLEWCPCSFCKLGDRELARMAYDAYEHAIEVSPNGGAYKHWFVMYTYHMSRFLQSPSDPEGNM